MRENVENHEKAGFSFFVVCETLISILNVPNRGERKSCFEEVDMLVMLHFWTIKKVF